MNSAATAEGHNAVASVALEDVDLASRSPARLLISARTPQAVETLARRIHDAGPRARFPFRHVYGAALPVQRDVAKEYCANVLTAAAGGSVLVSAVEEMPLVVQDALIELLDELECARGPAAGVRLISGTTVSLFDRVAAGAFSDRLFYRLNIIQVSVGDDGPDVGHAKSAVDWPVNDVSPAAQFVMLTPYPVPSFPSSSGPAGASRSSAASTRASVHGRRRFYAGERTR